MTNFISRMEAISQQHDCMVAAKVAIDTGPNAAVEYLASRPWGSTVSTDDATAKIGAVLSATSHRHAVGVSIARIYGVSME